MTKEFKQQKKIDKDRVTLQLKSKASLRGQVMLSNGSILSFINGKMLVPHEDADILLNENNDFEEVK